MMPDEYLVRIELMSFDTQSDASTFREKMHDVFEGVEGSKDILMASTVIKGPVAGWLEPVPQAFPWPEIKPGDVPVIVVFPNNEDATVFCENLRRAGIEDGA